MRGPGLFPFLPVEIGENQEKVFVSADVFTTINKVKSRYKNTATSITRLLTSTDNKGQACITALNTTLV